MALSDIRIHDVENRWESLALSLQAVSGWAGLEIDYCSLCAALGLSLMTTSTGRDDDCLWRWMAYGRDVRLVEAAALFALRLREAHPPDAARNLDRAPGFAQHFEASYQPIVLRALENDQPVLAWQGWPAPRQVMWGVITGPSDGGIGLAGVTIWSDGRTVPLVGPPVQLYVVEEASPRQPSHDELLRFVIDSAHRVLHNELDERWGIVTGSRAYDLWAKRLTGDSVCPPCGDRDGSCHLSLIHI